MSGSLVDAITGLVWGAFLAALVCWGLTFWQHGSSGISRSAMAEPAPGALQKRKLRQELERRHAAMGAAVGAALGAVTWPQLRGSNWPAAITFEPALGALVGGVVGGGFLVLSHQNRPSYARRWSSLVMAVIGGAVAGFVLVRLSEQYNLTFPGWDWAIVMGLGCFVAIGELISRYKDAPTRALLTTPALLYMSINAAAAATAFALVPVLGWSVSAGQDANGVHWPQVLAAGFGAMAVLRSAVFTVRTGDIQNGGKDVGVGPSSFLDAVINAADRALDRVRAQERSWAVARAMEQVSFQKAVLALPSYVVELTQNLSDDDRKSYLEATARLRRNPDGLPEHTALLNLGLLTINKFGEGVLNAALLSLSNEVRIATVQAAAKAAQTEAAVNVTKDQAAELLQMVKELKSAQSVSRSPAELDVETVVAKGEQLAAGAEVAARTAAEASAKAANTVQVVAASAPGALPAVNGTSEMPKM